MIFIERYLLGIAISLVFTLIANALPVSKNKKLTVLCKTLTVCINNNSTTADLANNYISLHYRYSGYNSHGQELPLKNGTVLYNKDLFNIEVTALKSTYLYLFYIDSSGNIQELLHQSAQSNHLQQRQTLLLPGSIMWPYFELDEQPGLETIYAIVSSYPRPDLIKIHGQKDTDGLTITCQCGDPCVKPFIINHLMRH